MKPKNAALVALVVLLVAVLLNSSVLTKARDVLADARLVPSTGVTGRPLAGPVGTGFTYQGELWLGDGSSADGYYDFSFGLYASQSGGSPIASVEKQNVLVTLGLFSVELDFGAGAFDGNERWLEIWVQPADGDEFILVGERQKVTAAPHALYSINSDMLDGLQGTAYALAGHGHNAADITSGTLASGRLAGSYAGISALGTLTGLSVSGDTSVNGEYLYSTAKTRVDSIGSTEFDSGYSTVEWSPGSDGSFRAISVCDAGSCILVAGVHLPQGSTVSGLSCKVSDRDPAVDLVVSLMRNPGNGVTYGTGCSVSTTGSSSGIQTISNVCSVALDYQSNSYFLKYDQANTCMSLGWCAITMCTITYTESRVP